MFSTNSKRFKNLWRQVGKLEEWLYQDEKRIVNEQEKKRQSNKI